MSYAIKGTIEGLAPILFNAPDLDMLKPKGSQRQMTEEQRDQEAMKRCYMNGQGAYLPAWNLKKCLLQGFQTLDLRVPGSKMKRLWRFVQPVMFVEPSELPFGIEMPKAPPTTPAKGSGKPFLHKCPGRNADGSATIVRRPALSEGWQVPFTLRILDDLVRSEDVRLAADAAGERVGLGGWRPEYGRFTIKTWEIAKAK